jgi:hypothetical protein
MRTTKSVAYKSTSELVKEADLVFSHYIRLKDSKNGYCSCFVCGTSITVGQAQCGHFIPRACMPTRFLIENCHPVCITCNCFDSDHNIRYAIAMEVKYGSEMIAEIIQRSRSLAKFTRSELLDIILTYKAKLKQLGR